MLQFLNVVFQLLVFRLYIITQVLIQVLIKNLFSFRTFGGSLKWTVHLHDRGLFDFKFPIAKGF